MSTINIIWASMFGTAEDVAYDVFEDQKSNGVAIHEMNDVSMDQFKEMNNVIFVTSTTGVGDVPTNGEEFWTELEKADLDLKETKYAVCALGASYHKEFCGAGRKIDARMEELGAERVSEIHKCDDDDEGAREYSVAVIKKILG